MLKPWLREQWCLPAIADAEYVARLEDVVAVYHRPYDSRYPQLCMDEISKQLLAQARPPVPLAPGQPAREDFEYVREGVCNVFLACEPLAGKRYTQVTAHRTKTDWAHFIRALVDDAYPTAEKLVLVLDNLNTHTLGA